MPFDFTLQHTNKKPIKTLSKETNPLAKDTGRIFEFLIVYIELSKLMTFTATLTSLEPDVSEFS